MGDFLIFILLGLILFILATIKDIRFDLERGEWRLYLLIFSSAISGMLILKLFEIIFL